MDLQHTCNLHGQLKIKLINVKTFLNILQVYDFRVIFQNVNHMYSLCAEF